MSAIQPMAPARADAARLPSAASTPQALVEVRNLQTEIPTPRGLVTPVRDVSFTVKSGEMLGIVGETGSGKSLTVRSVMGLLPQGAYYAQGSSVRVGNFEVTGATARRLRRFWGSDVALIPQDPTTSLNPVRKIGAQLGDVVKRDPSVPRDKRGQRAAELLTKVGIADSERRLNLYPHELSGGMRQRVLIAMAIALSPKLLIADEPTTALDVTIQKQILELIDELRTSMGTSVILVSHDLAVIEQYCDRVLVMYGGKVVESTDAESLIWRARHPYTRALLVSHPTIDAPPRVDLPTIGGEPPDIRRLPKGCPFAARCSSVLDICHDVMPPLEPAADQTGTQLVACHAPYQPTPADEQRKETR